MHIYIHIYVSTHIYTLYVYVTFIHPSTACSDLRWQPGAGMDQGW